LQYHPKKPVTEMTTKTAHVPKRRMGKKKRGAELVVSSKNKKKREGGGGQMRSKGKVGGSVKFGQKHGGKNTKAPMGARRPFCSKGGGVGREEVQDLKGQYPRGR